MPTSPKLYAVPAHLPFLDALAAGVLAMGDAPEGLSRATLLLPTRRAARALRLAFLRQAGGGALLLPRMRALAGLSTEDADELALPALLELPPAVDPLRRAATLAAMVARHPQFDRLSAAQAWHLAEELARLFDEVALEESDFAPLAAPPADFAAHWLARLDGLVNDERLAQHWQVTTAFLRAMAIDWARWLEREGVLDIGQRRAQALLAQAEAWRKAPPTDAVIAAGIGAGGTVPAAAALLGVVARLPRGAVVLPAMPAATTALWEAVAEAPTHPFYGYFHLLRAIGAGPGDLRDDWPGNAVAARAPAARAALLTRALLPASATAGWSDPSIPAPRGGDPGLERLRTGEPGEEAAAIALRLRGALETSGVEAALVTADRDLARRVSAELARHGVAADDSAGAPIGETLAGGFLRLIARAVRDRLAPVPLLSVFKHPLCAAGFSRPDWLATARGMDRHVLRGTRPGPGLAGLRAAAGEVPHPRTARALEAIESALGPLETLTGGAEVAPAALLAALLDAAEALAATDTLPGGVRLYAGEEGEPLATYLAALGPALAGQPPLPPDEWPELLDAVLRPPLAPALRATRTRAAHPRVAILGLLEARLLSPDLLVLGALEEGIWPAPTPPGPWMGRPMRAAFGLPPPEARIGREAADFLLGAASAGQVVLSAASRRGGAPAVPARFLTRIETLLHAAPLPSCPAAAWAAALDRPAAVRPWRRPCPAPPPAVRPRELSLSDVGLLIADPYAFHAKRTLRLKPLDGLDAEVGALEYGTLVHDAMRDFLGLLAAEPRGSLPSHALELWERAVGEALAQFSLRPGIAAFWKPRLANIGSFVLREEGKLRQAGGLVAAHAEVEATRTIDDAVALHARADRIDALSNGRWRILDFKTGEPPTQPRLDEGSDPQLPIEAWLLSQDGFRSLTGVDPQAISIGYWQLHGGDGGGEAASVSLTGRSGEDLIARAEAGVLDLVRRYLLGDAPFTARPHPKRAARGREWEHLARSDEWSDAATDA